MISPHPREPGGGGVAAVGPVVVGFGGSRAAWDALRWAADEAGHRRATLEVVHCAACPLPTTATSGRSDANPASMRDQLDQAARVAGLRGCQIAVRASVAEGSPAEVLVERSRGAAVLVLGCHDPGPTRPPANESLSDYCRLNAFCPVTVVDPASWPDHH